MTSLIFVTFVGGFSLLFLAICQIFNKKWETRFFFFFKKKEKIDTKNCFLVEIQTISVRGFIMHKIARIEDSMKLEDELSSAQNDKIENCRWIFESRALLFN